MTREAVVTLLSSPMWMSRETVIALLSSPVLIALITLFFRYREAHHKRQADRYNTSFTRLEEENQRLTAEKRALERRIAELREQGDQNREEIHALRERIAVLRRRMIELGIDEAMHDG